MALKNPDITEHNNADLAAMDADFVRGARRRVANLTALYALGAKADQLKVFVSEVYVDSLGYAMLLIDAANIDNIAGWGALDYTKKLGGNVFIGEQAFKGSIFGRNPSNIDTWYITDAGNASFGGLSLGTIGINFYDGADGTRRHLFYEPSNGYGGGLWIAPNAYTAAVRLATTTDTDAAKAYADTLVTSLFHDRGNYNPNYTGMYPPDSVIKKGDIWTISVAGTVNWIPVDVGDTIRALTDDPGYTNANWAISQANVYQASETERGISKVATAEIAADENTINDTDFITGKKLWNNFWTRAITLPWNLLAKITFNSSPRFSSVTANQYLKVDGFKDLTSVAAIPATDVTEDATHRFATDAEKTAWSAKQNALGYTPENVANKGAANGYAPLGSDSKIASAYLPSYVDDVLEYANLAAFPVTGETGKMYVALDTNKIYRWSGSVYIEISGSPGSTDAVAEGATNLYFTGARVLASALTGYVATNGTIAATDTILQAFNKLGYFISTLAELKANKDATGGYVGLTLFKINFKNVANTFTSFFTNSNTAARTYTFQDRDGTIADNTDITSAKARANHTGTQAATTIVEDATHRFATDTEKTTWNAKQSALSIPSDAEMQAGTDNAKYVTALRATSWWAWLKSNPMTLGFLSGTGNRVLQTNASGDISAPNEVLDGFVTDSDVITAITGATYNSGNNFTATISPSGKFMYQGQMYNSGAFFYLAILDNSVIRITKS